MLWRIFLRSSLYLKLFAHMFAKNLTEKAPRKEILSRCTGDQTRHQALPNAYCIIFIRHAAYNRAESQRTASAVSPPTREKAPPKKGLICVEPFESATRNYILNLFTAQHSPSVWNGILRLPKSRCRHSPPSLSARDSPSARRSISDGCILDRQT